MPAPMGHAPYNTKGEGGRPKKWDEIKLDEEADALIAWIDAEPTNIFISKFCFQRGYNDQKVSEWARTHERYRDAYNLLLTKQKVMLFEGGLTKRLYYPMCALLLSHHHNIHLKTEQAVTADVTTQGLIAEIADQTKDIIDITDSVKELTNESRGVDCEVEGPLLEDQQPLSDSGQEGTPDTV